MAAETKLQNLVYKGELRRWNFERYAQAHQEQFNILEGLKEHGYSGIDARSRVRYLNQGIKTNALDTPKTHIMNSVALRSDFEKAVVVYKDFIKQTQADGGQVLNVSDTRSRPENPKNPNGKRGSVHVEERYYTSQEYSRLSQPQKKRLKELRASRGKNDTKKVTLMQMP